MDEYVICGYPKMPIDSFSASMQSLEWAFGDVGEDDLWEKIKADVYHAMDDLKKKPTAELVRNKASKYVIIINPETDEKWDAQKQKWIKK